MVLRIIQKANDEWYWLFELDRGDAVCRSENSRSFDGGYSRKSTALKSAERFAHDYIDDHIPITIMDGFSDKILNQWNSY